MADQKQGVPPNKKISEMTRQETEALMKPVGLPGLPYPMAYLEKNAQGVMQHKVGVIESAQNPLLVYTQQPLERVNGMLIRQMPTPSMMFMLRDLLTKLQPESKNRIITLFGDAASGKSHILKLVFGMSHPQGAIAVDCGGMNMREIFFRTVIDYGQGVKEQFDKRVRDGKVDQTSLQALEAAFPGSVVTNGGATGINWEAIGQPRQKDEDGKKVNAEDRGDAAIRAADVLTSVYKKEGIDVQTNAFGIKTVPGEWFESINSGRPLFLDEFNKSKKGTLDAFQTALQFANGEIDEVTIYNPMAQAGDGDSPKSITIKRDDLRIGWGIGVAGNDAADGDTTQELSVSMLTRLNPMRIGVPELEDWKHRISQVWTGLPITTMYQLFGETAKNKPAEFSKLMVDLRKLGLSAQEQNAIPPHEIYLLQHFQETVQAIDMVADYYAKRLKLSDPESDMLQQPAFQKCADEIASNGDRIFVSFRKVIADFNQAIQSMPEVRKPSEATLSLNLSEVFKNVDLSSLGRTKPGWHRLGENMSRAILEDITNDTIGMPFTNTALVTLCETGRILSPDLKEAKPSKDGKPGLSQLLKYDELKDFGGTEELSQVRDVLMAALKSQYPDIKQADDYIIPLDALGRTLASLTDKKSVSPQSFVVPNNDVNSVGEQPLAAGKALPNYLLDSDSKGYELVNYRSALAALAVPGWADANRKHIWPVALDEYLVPDPEPDAKAKKKMTPDEIKAAEEAAKADLEAHNCVKGQSKIGFDLVILSAANDKAQPVYLYVIEDKQRQKMIVVGADAISPTLSSALKKNGVQYVLKDDADSVAQIDEFLAEGARKRGENGAIATGTTQGVIESLIKAFSTLCDLSGADGGSGQPTVGKGATMGKIIHGVKVKEPALYTSIMKPAM